MGTHPIFESDFDCLTDDRNRGPKPRRVRTEKFVKNKWILHMDFTRLLVARNPERTLPICLPSTTTKSNFTRAGQGTIPARINATTISIDAARSLTPINVTISQDNVPSGVNISWINSQQSQFMSANYTLNWRMDGPDYEWNERNHRRNEITLRR